MANSREHFALDWIKSELLETLNDARLALEAYAESDGDETRMRACLTGLHQAHGTLVMLELSGVTLLADHLERVAQAVLNGEVADSGNAGQSLMQGILELPGHLDEIQRGLPDSKQSVLPLVNELRRFLGEPKLEDPGDVTPIATGAPQAALDRFEGIDGIDKVRKIRAAYQQVLLSILKGEDLAGGVTMMFKVAHGLCRVVESTPHESIWMAFGQFVESLRGHAGPVDGAAVKLLRRVDSEIRDLAVNGAKALRKPVPMDLLTSLLDAAESRGQQSDVLDGLRGSLEQGDRSDGLAISGREALSSAATALRDELILVKDQLDLFVRSEAQHAPDLGALTAPLKQIGSTLSLLGFESSKTIVADQIDLLTELSDAKEIDPQVLVGVATSLVQVDENLASFTQSGKSEAQVITDDAQRTLILETRTGLDSVKQAIVDFISSQWDARHLDESPDRLLEMCRALSILPLPRAAALLERCSEYIRTQLVSGTEPSWEEMDHLADAISGVDYYLERLAQQGSIGTEDVLDLVERSLDSLGAEEGRTAPTDADVAREQEPVREPVLESVREPVREPDSEQPAEIEDLEAASQTAPQTASDTDSETDLEAAPDEIADHEPDREPVLEMDDDTGFDLDNDIFAELGDSHALPERSSEAAEAAAEAAGAAGAEKELEADELHDDEEIAEDEVAEAAAVDTAAERKPSAAEPSAAAARMASMADTFETDADIVEIFVEEVGEVLETVDEYLPHWASDLSNENAMSEVRRAFHTLKGSGRIVGSNILGEMAWSVENMLNRIIDGTVAPTPQFVTVVEEARSLAPSLRDAYETQLVPDMEAVAVIMERADVLASGGELEERQAVAEAPEEIIEAMPETLETEAAGADEAAPDSQPADVEADTATGEGLPEEDESLNLFVGEAEGHLTVLDEAFATLSTRLDEDAVRALHTLAGSSAMAGIDRISNVARPAYDLAQALVQAKPETEHGGAVAEFYTSYLDAMHAGVDALRAGLQPDENSRLIADAERLLVSLSTPPDESDELLALPGLNTLMEATVYLDEWRDGAMNLGYAEDLVEVLDSVTAAAERTARPAIATLAQALNGAHDALEHAQLTQADHGVLLAGHETLLRTFDALAAGQRLGDTAATVAALDALVDRERNTDADEEELQELIDLEEEIQEQEEDLASIFADDATAEARTPLARETEDIDIPLPGGEVVDFPSSSPGDQTGEQDEAEEILVDDLPIDEVPDQQREASADFEDESSVPHDEVREGVSADADLPPAVLDDHKPSSQEELPDSAPAIAAELLPEDLDEEIIEVFFEEADEILETLDESIHQWQTEPDNRIHLEHLLRALHTLKGGARLSGLTALGDMTHQYESFLIDMQGRDAVPEADFFAELTGQYDELTNMVGSIRRALDGDLPLAAESTETVETRADSEPPAASRKPRQTRKASVPGDKPQGPERDSRAPRPSDERAAASTKTRKRGTGSPEDEIRIAKVGDADLGPTPIPSPPPASSPVGVVGAKSGVDDQRPEQRSSQEMVRVGSGLLEELVNLAGESSIVRARIEQGINDFTSSLDEMETTIERVREQLRRLEMETETQILFRRDRDDGPSYEEFDPLEMDRYSQLQQLSRALSESASDMLDLKDTLLFKARESETLLLQQARINTELQEGLMRTRMVPFSRLLPRLRRIVRQVATEVDKEVELHAYNVEGELDRSLLDRMVPPLEHMLRNAVDHGIESKETRTSYGKPAAGRIELRLSREGGDVVIEISDDGAGIDTETVREKAVERGLMAADAELTDDEISQFVLAPGFSTAKSVTQISGRGVGMDVVASEVKQLGGSINILSRPAKGTQFVLRVPFTVSVNRALMVSVGDDLYAIPLNTIEGIVLLTPEELERLYAPDGNTFEYAGVPYRVRYLGHYLGREFRAASQYTHAIPVVLVRSGDHAVAVHVDAVQGSREIVVKSLGPQFAGVGGISGATILGDGSVVVILDLLALIRAQSSEGLVSSKRPLAGAGQTRCVMVVDDSVTVRKVTSRLLERQGMDVIVAKDGIEAVAQLQERRPDVMLLDIEMPRMDGFEVARQVRHDERLQDLPIIMISSRTGEKHQERALELGVNRFLGKPFQENELLATIDDLVGES